MDGGMLGILFKIFALAAIEEGMGTCLQEAWAEFPETVKKHIKHSDDEIVWCGISLGYPDLDHPVNKFRTGRESLKFLQNFCKYILIIFIRGKICIVM